MNTENKLSPLAAGFAVACLLLSTAAFAKPEPEACVTLGAMAYDDWTSVDGGGSGLPSGESNVEYLRCNSCHGWDRLGLKGGYVRRERTADHPNTGLGDANTVSRDIAPGLGNYYEIDVDEVLHAGTGRTYEDGSASWVTLGVNPTPEELAAHAAGYTLGNLHPDFSTTGVNAGDTVLTQDQVECLVDFINNADSDPKWYFQEIDEDRNPVKYTIASGASATAGRTFYEQNCVACHGEPNQNANGALPEGGMVTYLQQDGAYSEFVHHARWGIPDTLMTRAAVGTPDAQDMIDLMLYLQEYVAGSTGYAISVANSGSWYLAERSGEGFAVDVAPAPEEGEWIVAASYYTYDGFGNQVYLVGFGPVEGDHAVVTMYITSGGIFGTLYDKELVVTEPWGNLEFSFSSCWAGHVKVVPSQETIDLGVGFETFEFDLERLTAPSYCP